MSDRIKKWISNEWKHLAFWTVFVWIVFGYSLFFDFFIFDDHLHFYDNAHVGVRSWHDLLYFWKNSLTPIVFFIWQIISIFFGNESATVFRIFNFLLMGGIGYLLFNILEQLVSKFSGMGSDYYKYLPYFATIVYILHPAQIESVIWVSSGRTLLATFFALLSCRMFQLGELNIQNKKYEYLTVAFFVLGLLSKPSVVMLPFLILGLQLINGNKLKASLLKIWPLLAIGLILGLLHSLDVLTPHLKSLDIKTRALIYLDSIIFYLKMVFIPIDVIFNYARTPQQVLLDYSKNPTFFILMPFTILTFLVASIFTKALKGFGFFLCLFFTLLIPNMGIVQYDFQNISTVSNRYLNFPLLALAIGTIFLGKLLIDRWHLKKNKLVFLCSSFVFILLVLSFRSGYAWNSSEKLLLKNAGNQLYPNAMSLGIYFGRNGKYKEAEESFYNAWEADTTSLAPVISLIGLYQKYNSSGNIVILLKKIEDEKIIVPAFKTYELANLYYNAGNFKEALELSNVSFQARIKVIEAKELFHKSEKALEQKKLNTYLKLIRIYIDENRLIKAHSTTLEAKAELGNHPSIERLLKNELKNIKK